MQPHDPLDEREFGSSGRPEDAPGSLDDPPDAAEGAPGKPDAAPAAPDDAPGKPDAAPAAPDDAPGKPDAAPAGPDDAPGKHDDHPRWPDDAPDLPSPPPRQAGASRFAWRAGVLWLFAGILQLGAALVVAWLAGQGDLVGVGPWLVALLLAILAVAFLRTRAAVQRGDRWATAPSQALAWGLILGGFARFIVSLGQSSVTIPLEPLLGLWALTAGDAPRVRLAWSSDRRTAVVAALVIATELTSIFPAIPASTPGLAVFSSGPDSLALTIQPQCQSQGSGWDRVPIEVSWDWRGLDVFGSAHDSVTISVQSSAPNLQLDTTDYSYGMFGDTMLPDLQTLVVSLPPGTRTGGYSVIAVQVLEPVPASLTVRVAYHHGDRWVVEQTAGCPA